MSAAGLERSRREVVGLGIAAGATALAASTAAPLLTASDAFAQADDDASIVEAAIGLEQQAVLAYTAAAKGDKLGRGSGRAARLFARQEQEHADVLIAALKDLGGTAPEKPSNPREIPGLAEAAAGSQDDFARFAIEFETAAVQAYYEATARLKDPKLLSAAVSIMANEAQHLVVLRQAIGQNPSPHAFVTGQGE